jgi:hypothetical protein
MRESSNSFRSVEEQVASSFDTALTEAQSKVEEAKTKALGRLKV